MSLWLLKCRDEEDTKLRLLICKDEDTSLWLLKCRDEEDTS